MVKIFKEQDMESILIDYIGVSEEALLLAIRLLGSRKEVYEDILFVYTGYHDFEQYIEGEVNEK
jgi:hypothetical protein